jgi:anti-anti-sigma factor
MSAEQQRVFSPKGRLDGTNAAATEKELMAFLESGEPNVVIDLGAVDYMSSAGLRVLLVAAKAARARAGKVVLAAPRPSVNEVLTMSGFDRIMTLEPDLVAASRALRA